MVDDNNSSGDRGQEGSIDRRSLLRNGTVSLAGIALLAGCSGNDGNDGNGGGGDTATEQLEKTSKVKNVEQKLPDYYPDNYWRTLRKAQQEGSITLYTSHFGSFSESYAKAFNEFCPWINVQVVNLSTAKVYQRFSSEASQGVWEPDLVHTYDAVALSQMNNQDILLNYDSPEKEHYGDMWKSDDGTVLAPQYNPYSNAFNPGKMSGDPPMSLEGLAQAIKQNPDQWDGNFAMYDGQLSTSMWQTMLQWKEIYGQETMEKHLNTLASANPKTFWSTSTMGEWVAKGEVKYGIALAHFILDAYIAPEYSDDQIQWEPAEDIISNIFLGGTQIVKKPSNPNAAKVYFDWFNSPAGQKFFCNNWNIVTTHDQVKKSDVESTYADLGKMTHKNISSNTEFVNGYDTLSKAGSEKSDLKSLWYRTFVGGG